LSLLSRIASGYVVEQLGKMRPGLIEADGSHVLYAPFDLSF
jgi:hypothetical protein